MFIRFVRGMKDSKRTKNKLNIYKFASVGLLIVIVASLIARTWGFASNDASIKKWLSEKTALFYKELALKGYNIASYSNNSNIDEENNMMEQLVNAINEHSSLYGYLEKDTIEMSFCKKDPSYNYTEVVSSMDDIIMNYEEQLSDSKNHSDKPNEEITSDYVVPAISEAGITYTMEQLSDFDFLMSKLYTVPSRAKVYESDLVAKDMLEKDMTIKGDNSKPQILIYHTHSQEGFVDSKPGDDSTSIIGVGAYLAKILSEEYGYNVIHCQEHFDMAEGKLDRSKAYTYAQYTIEQILEDNPTIDVILDLHRDGLKEGSAKLVTNINGKDTAKIMFFNGVSRSSAAGDIDYLYNRYRADNLAFSFKLKLKAMECYPEFTRRNYIDAYQYNLHHRQKSVLVEVGAQNNTLQEELNAMEVLAEVLHRVISPEKE